MSLPIAKSVLPLERAEELILTLAGVISARIVAGDNGSIEAVHVLTGDDTPPKQTVRNVESALLAHLGLKIDHRKISVAISSEKRDGGAAPMNGSVDNEVQLQLATRMPGRRLYFEDVEVRGSRAKGVTCKVSLRKGKQVFTGEASGVESDRSRVELAARATLEAIVAVESSDAAAPEGARMLSFHGVRIIDAFERNFVFVCIMVQAGRGSKLLTGTCEINESAETAGALAVLDATNRWMDFDHG